MMKKDWEIKRLGDYCKIRTGKLDANAACENGRYPFFTCSITPLKINSYSFDCECVLVAGNGDLNVKYYEGKFDAYQRTYIIESVDKTILDVHYLYSFLSSYIDELRKQSIGAIIKYIKLGNLTEAPIPIPPLEEQKRIVKILDEKFAQLESLKANAQTNLQNAKDLFQSQLAKAFSNTTWEKKRLGDICRITSGGTPSRTNKSYWENGNIPWVKTTELQNNELNSTEEFITQKGLDESSAKIVPKDTILLAMYGQGKTRGMTAYLNIEATTNQACACILPSEDKNIYPKYIWKFLIGNYENIRNLAIGCNQPNLNSAMVKSIEIPLPPLPEQKSIVQRLDSLNEKIKQLQAIYTKQILDCDELKQSLLKQAFEGEL